MPSWPSCRSSSAGTAEVGGRMSLLETYGWSPFFAAAFEAHAAPGRVPARVVADLQAPLPCRDRRGRRRRPRSPAASATKRRDPRTFPRWATGWWWRRVPAKSARPSTRCCPGAGVCRERPRGPRRASRCWPPTSTPSSWWPASTATSTPAVSSARSCWPGTAGPSPSCCSRRPTSAPTSKAEWPRCRLSLPRPPWSR